MEEIPAARMPLSPSGLAGIKVNQSPKMLYPRLETQRCFLLSMACRL
jgi:hypothetical protein